MLLPYTAGVYYGPACAAMVVLDAAGALDDAGAVRAISPSLSVTSTGTADVLRPYRGYAAALQGLGEGSIACTPHKRMRAGITVSVGATPSAEDIAQIVWGSAASVFNAAGTMGAKLNAAGSGGVDLNALATAVWAHTVRGLTATVDANIVRVNGVLVTGTGATGDTWGPA
jgi:hypothetical protein